MSNTLKFLWWDEFRYANRANARRLSLYAHGRTYAPILTQTATPIFGTNNAPKWDGDGEETVSFAIDPASPSAAYGRQFANAYLFSCNQLYPTPRMDGLVPFCPFPNNYGKVIENDDDASADWITPRTNMTSLVRHANDLMGTTFMGDPVDARSRGGTGWAENGIAATYEWCRAFLESAKEYIDDALGHALTKLEIYDDLESMGFDLDKLLRPISTGSPHRMIDAMKADARWSTKTVDGTQTWQQFHADTLTAPERAILDDPAQVNIYADANVALYEKTLGFLIRTQAYQFNETLRKAAVDIWGARFLVMSEYAIWQQTTQHRQPTTRTSAAFSDRTVEYSGAITLFDRWVSSPVCYQRYGILDDAVRGNLATLAAAFGYVSAGNAAADGRLMNIAWAKEKVRRAALSGRAVVPWLTFNRYSGGQTGIIIATDMTAADHLNVLDAWVENGLDRFIYWGNPGLGDWETDFGPFIDQILPSLTASNPDPPPSGNPNPLDVPAWQPEPGVPLLRMRTFQGDRFRLPFPVLAAEPGIDLAGIVVRAQVRVAPEAPLIHDFVPVQTARPGGIRFVLMADTDAWPLGTVLCDVKISGPGIPETLAFRVWVRVVRKQG